MNSAPKKIPAPAASRPQNSAPRRAKSRPAAAHFIAAAASAPLFPPPAARALEPDEIAVLFNTQSPDSLLVARYYMNARKIPLNHLIPVTCDASENISESQYRSSFVPRVLKQLAERQLDSEKPGNVPIKCLVTTIGIPLRIGAQVPTVAERGEIADLQKQLADTLQSLTAETAAYDHIAAALSPDAAPGAAPAANPPAPRPPPPLRSPISNPSSINSTPRSPPSASASTRSPPPIAPPPSRNSSRCSSAWSGSPEWSAS